MLLILQNEITPETLKVIETKLKEGYSSGISPDWELSETFEELCKRMEIYHPFYLHQK